MSAATISVPLGHNVRTAHYRARGMSNGKIARKFGIAERGVPKLLKRVDA